MRSCRGGGGVFEPEGEAEDYTPGRRFRLTGNRGAVGVDIAADLGLRIRVEVPGEVGGGLAYSGQQIVNTGEIVAIGVDFGRRSEGDPEVGAEGEFGRALGGGIGLGGVFPLNKISTMRRLTAASYGFSSLLLVGK